MEKTSMFTASNSSLESISEFEGNIFTRVDEEGNIKEINLKDISIWTKEDWVNTNLKQFSDSRKDVLEFIYNIVNKFSYINLESCETIENLFACGYCYYFALMLKDAFGGKVCWHYGHGHIVWVDETDIAYDIHGVFTDYNEGELIPIDKVDKRIIERFRHRGHDRDISNAELKPIIEKCKPNKSKISFSQ